MKTPHWLHIFCIILSTLTAVLLLAGALVTGTGSGLAVPDWPLSFGQAFPPMIGGVLFEHGHRMVAGTVGIVTLLLVICIWFKEPRRKVKYLASIALIAVITQAVLGGMTVLFKLPIAVSVTHACLAQIFFSLTIILSLVTSKYWFQLESDSNKLNFGIFSLKTHAFTLSFLFFLQILLGAITRHLGAGLAIPDFPLSFGKWIPNFSTMGIVFHYFHRVGAFSLVVLTIALVLRVQRVLEDRLDFIALSGALLSLVFSQFMLGAVTIWAGKPVVITTLHLLVGGMCFGCANVISILFWAASKLKNTSANDTVEIGDGSWQLA